jgi:hypothetical protein
MRLPSLIAAAAGLVLLSADASADACPESCVLGDCSTSAQRDTTAKDYDRVSSATYDLVTGRISVGFAVYYACGAAADVAAHDRFTLAGPSSSGPVSFVASLRVVGQVSEATIRGSLGEGASPPVVAEITAAGYSTFDRTVTLKLTHRVGEPFELAYLADGYGASCYASGGLTGTLTFPGLPSGYGLTSCQGFSTGVVPTRPLTWGQMKIRYR